MFLTNVKHFDLVTISVHIIHLVSRDKKRYERHQPRGILSGEPLQLCRDQRSSSSYTISDVRLLCFPRYIVCFSLRRLLNRLNSVSSILDRRARRQVTLYSSQSNEPLRTYSRFKDTAYCGTYRRDGKLLVAGCEDGDVRLFDCKAKSMLRVFKAHQGLVEGWSRVGRGLVEGWSRVGPGLVEGWSRVGRGLVEGWSRVGPGLV